jgi:V8-like Glu-specific endopeptidase
VAIEPHILVTAGHCVDSMRGHTTLVALGRDFAGPGVLVDRMWRVDPPQDIGLMHVDGTLPVTAALTQGGLLHLGAPPRPGERLTLVGYGCDSKWPPFTRSERGANAFVSGGGLVLFDGVVCHGDSGGAVFDRGGRLVAVMVASAAFLPGSPEVNVGTLIEVALPGLLGMDAPEGT